MRKVSIYFNFDFNSTDGLTLFFPELLRPEQDGSGLLNPPKSGGHKISIKNSFSGRYCQILVIRRVDKKKTFIIHKSVLSVHSVDLQKQEDVLVVGGNIKPILGNCLNDYYMLLNL